MKVVVLVKATAQSEAGVPSSDQAQSAMRQYNEELIKAGVLLDGGGLQPSLKAKRVRFSGSQRVILDGPFPEVKELVAGYWVWQVRSIEEAVEWARRCPLATPGEDAEVELRPVEPDRVGGW